jgi:hypothetical protein
MLSWLRNTFWRVVARFRSTDGASPPPRAAAAPPLMPVDLSDAPIPAPIIPAPESAPQGLRQAIDTQQQESSHQQSPHPQLNRSLRRRLSALERARRKRDQFVTPQGQPHVPKHVEHERKQAEPGAPVAEAAPPVDEVPTAEYLIADKHHAGDNEDVLYKETEYYGEYNFRDTILEQLERYFVYLRRMKTCEPDVYGLYKEIGAILVPYASIMPDMATRRYRTKHKPITVMPKLSPWFKQNRPGFGCIAYGANPLAEQRELIESATAKSHDKWIMVPKFMYFHKYEQPPPEVQPMSDGDVYAMSIWWDRPHDPKFKRKHGTPTEYAVFISNDGESLRILRQCETKMVQAVAKRDKKWIAGRRRGSPSFSIPQRCWRIPKTFEDWAEERHEDVQIHLGNIFVNAMNHYEQASYSMVRIAVKKDDMVGVFSVNIRRMAYFFKDRDYVLTEHGGRKPVFHMVRAHERHTVKGTRAVKFHFRGERQFTWAGYQVSITVPGRDHFMLPEYDVGAVDEYWMDAKDKKDSMRMPELAKKMAGWIDSGLGGRR